LELGFAAVLLSLLGGLALRAQNPPANQQPPSSPGGQSTTEKTPAKPSEKGKEPQAEGAQPLRLDNPQPTATPSSQPSPQTPQNPPAKPSQPPPAAPAQKLQLETPKEAPAPQKAPVLTTPVGPSQPQAPPTQATIESIIFRGNRRIPAATLRARIFSHAGDVYNESALDRDFMALWNTGYFDDIRLEVTDAEKGGKIVTFFVREKKLVRSIDYKGLSSVETSDVLDEFKKRKVGLSIQSQYDPVVIKRAEVVLEEMLAAHGKMFATVRHRTRNIPPNSVALTFIVVEGPKVKVGNVRFEGNQVFSSRVLERSMKYSRAVGAPPWFYWFHKTYDKDKIEADLENIRDLYRDHGYFYALAKEPETKMVDTHRRYPFFFYSWGRGKRVDLTIPVEEGLQYHLGRFVIRGNKLFKQAQLAPILRLKTGDLFALSKVRKAIENYTKLYGQFGYINFTATPDIEPDNKRRLINLALDFEEDKQFFVHRIEFSGNTKTRDKVIRRELLLSEGDMFNSTFWDLSVLRVNQLGFFDTVKKEDYEITQNVKNDTVDITLKVKEKGKNSIGFSGGVSGLSGNFVGINYATNNFLGLGETLSIQTEWGTYQKLYSFGFTKPYLFDRPITAGFTVFRSDYRYDQLRYLAYAYGISQAALQSTPYGQYYAQNFQQNSSGFTMYGSYPLRRSFARVGLTYSYSYSSMQAFNAASESFFEAINFRGLAGPSALSGIISSSVMPTYLYNTINDAWNPTRGRYLSAGMAFSGLGGNVFTITPTLEFKYFHPMRNVKSEKPQAFGMRLLVSNISGYGGRVPPPFSRFYIGGEYDIRGFDIRSISPLAFFPSTTSVCNRDNFGNPILGTGATGQKGTTCGSSTSFPYYTPIYPGGDTEIVTNFEYRVPIVGPVTMAAFVDAGSAFVWRTNQLQIDTTIPSLQQLTTEYPYFKLPTKLRIIANTNFRPRSSTGLDMQVILPIVNAPFHLYYGYNWLRENNVLVVPPQVLPPPSMFPNQYTYEDAVNLFRGFRLREIKGRVGFTVARTF
jgi:outer membrane protein insertion porin family